MTKQQKLILTGVALIGGGVLLYTLLKPKKSRLENLTGKTGGQITQELRDYLNKVGGYNTAAAQQITGGAQWVPTQEQTALMYPSSTVQPVAGVTPTFVNINPYG